MDNLAKLTNIIQKHAHNIERVLGKKISIEDYNTTVIGGQAYFNILEAETIGEEERLFTRIKSVLDSSRDKQFLGFMKDEADNVELVQSSIQGLVNDELLVRKYQELYIATHDIEIGDYLPLIVPIHKGDMVMILSSTSDQICGLLHKHNGQIHQSLATSFSIVQPFLYRGGKNPKLYYRNNIFARITRNKKNVISNSHSSWIKTRLALRYTVEIKCPQNELQFLYKMLHDSNLLRHHNRIIINQHTASDLFYSNYKKLNIAQVYEINTLFSDLAFVNDGYLADKVSKIGSSLFKNRKSFGQGSKRDSRVGRIAKVAIKSVFKDRLSDILEDNFTISRRDMLLVLDEIRSDQFFYAGVRQAQSEPAFLDILEKAVEIVIITIRREKGTECASRRNYSVITDTETLIFSDKSSLYVTFDSKMHMQVFDFGISGSTYTISNDVSKIISKIRRRGERETITHTKALKHFSMIADEVNAKRLLALSQAVIVSFLIDYKLNVSVSVSNSINVNETFKDMMSGCYINDVISIIINDTRNDFLFAEEGSVLIKNKHPHNKFSSIVIKDKDADIVLRNQINNFVDKKDMVLTGRGSSAPDAVEFFYSVVSNLNIHFKSKKIIKRKIDEIGIFNFCEKYL